ncbi:hypothetical protein K7G91_000903 [Pasteurella canis]|uniref:hypothetical protein n=1 Tax=Pasteurella canis TaxID=753 RepID=UPI001D0F803C|nr:hypothetical protein [Pasteurella canis]UDW84616.1 hypothetical protein K7G91_000903 [Pasteurella canis]
MTTYNDDTPSDYPDADGKMLTIGEVKLLEMKLRAELEEIRKKLYNIEFHNINTDDLLSDEATSNDIKNGATVLELKARAYDIRQELDRIETTSPNPKHHYTGVYEDKPF